jgi:hypothetical protein
VRIRNYFEILIFSNNNKMGHKLQFILESKFQAPPTWNNLVPIPNSEVDTIIHCCWKTINDIMAEKRKFFGTTYEKIHAWMCPSG